MDDLQLAVFLDQITNDHMRHRWSALDGPGRQRADDQALQYQKDDDLRDDGEHARRSERLR